MNRKGEYQKYKIRIRKWRKNNPEKVKVQNKRWEEKHPESKENRKRYFKKYYRDHKEHYRKLSRNRYKSDNRYRLNRNLGSAIRNALKELKAGRKWEELVNYSLNDLIFHLEKRFSSGMTWDNYGSFWEVDHRVPKSSFSYLDTGDLEFKKCWSLGNLRPLEKSRNRRKGSKLNFRD